MTHFLKTLALLSLSYLATISAHAHKDEAETALGKEMSAMVKPYKSLSKAFRKAPNPENQAEYIANAQTILKHAKASVDFVPALAETLDAEAKAKMTAEYQAAMQKCVQTIEQLIGALEREDYASAQVLLAKLKKQKSDGHDQFEDDDE